jgi:hypothetical protein
MTNNSLKAGLWPLLAVLGCARLLAWRAFCSLDRTLHPDNSRRQLLLCWGLLVFLASPSSIHAQAPSRKNLESSCRKFVQEFYDWYIKTDARSSKTNVVT